MFGSIKGGANAYAKVGIETGVMSASPHKLIVLLYEGAETALRNALNQIGQNDIPGKGRSISKAIDIVQNGLRASLDKKAGAEIADNLDALYEYMVTSLLQANLNNDTAKLEEVLGLLGELRRAWEAIAPPLPVPPKAEAVNPVDDRSPRAAAYASA